MFCLKNSITGIFWVVGYESFCFLYFSLFKSNNHKSPKKKLL